MIFVAGEWCHFKNPSPENEPCVTVSDEYLFTKKKWLCPSCKESRNMKKTLEKTYIELPFNDELQSLVPNISDTQLPATIYSQCIEPTDTNAHMVVDDAGLIKEYDEILMDTGSHSADKVKVYENEPSPEEVCKFLGINRDVLDFIPETEALVKIKDSEWAKCFDYKTGKVYKKSKTNKTRYGQIIHEAIGKTGIVCGFNAKNVWYNKSTDSKGYMTVQGYCPCGMRLHAKILTKPTPGKDVEAIISTSGIFKLVQNTETGRQVSGKTRDKIKNLLKSKSSKRVFVDNYSHLDAAKYFHRNNIQKSEQSLRQMKCELKLKDKIKVEGRSKNDVMMQVYNTLKSDTRFETETGSKLTGFIQRISGVPSVCYMYCPQQVNLVAYANNLELYLDATGAGFAEPNSLLYAMVAKIKNSSVPSVVVAEAIMNRHSGTEICTFLSNFVADVKRVNNKPAFADSVTIDFSHALINAVSLAFNEESVLNYLHRAYYGMMKEEAMPQNKTKIFLCTGHILKAFSRNMQKKILSPEVRKLALHGLGSLIEAKNKEQYERAISRIVTLFDRKELPPGMADKYFNELQGGKPFQHSKLMDEFEMCVRSDEELEEFILPDTTTVKRENSPFYQHFHARRYTISKMWNTTAHLTEMAPNPFYNAEVCNILSDTYIAYAGLWSLAVPTNENTKNFGVSTTNCVESFFSKLKNVLHTSKKNEVHDFALDHSGVVLGEINSAFAIGLKGKSIRKPRDKINKQEMKQSSFGSKESWRKKFWRTGSRYVKKTLPEKLRVIPTPAIPENILKQNVTMMKTVQVEASTSQETSTSPIVIDLDSDLENPQMIQEAATIYANSGNCYCYGFDITSLMEKQYVGSEVINTYISLLIEQDETDNYKLLEGQFFRVLDNGKPTGSLSAFPKDLKQGQRLLFPTIFRLHYWLNDIDPVNYKIDIYDSMTSYTNFETRKCYMDVLISRLEAVIPNSKGHWKYDIRPSFQQRDGFNCGIWTMAFADELISGTPENIPHMDPNTPLFRNIIARKLLKTTDAGKDILKSYDNKLADVYAHFVAEDKYVASNYKKIPIKLEK